MKKVYGKIVFFFFQNLVGCGWKGLLRVGVVYDDKWVINVCVFLKLFHTLLLEQLLRCRYCIYSSIIRDKVLNFTELIFDLSQQKIMYFF